MTLQPVEQRPEPTTASSPSTAPASSAVPSTPTARRATARPHRAPRVRVVATVLFGFYLVVLAAAAFLPLPFEQVPHGDGPSWDLTLRAPDLLGGWEAQRNVLMTLPLGVLLPLVVRWRYEALVLTCLAVTVTIETVQLVVSASVGWAWRAFDVNDILLNTIGGVLGLAITGLGLLVARRATLPAPRRLLPGVVALALVAWAGAATFPLGEPPLPTPAFACDEAPVGDVTTLPGGASVYAGTDGSVCVLSGDTATAVAHDVATGPALTSEQPDGTWEVGAAQPYDVERGLEPGVELHAVDGTHLLVWAVRR
ncbi:VanZ family protein [Cellulomonas iranensis]|uniref:VanZ family protein n=1 Tax=Cellulomonas iranensis TaxID=76862 RepID=UPI003D7C9FA9